MTLKTVEWTERYVPVNKLSNLDVEFISLVPKGANMIPFQIIKSDETGEDDMNTIVQALSNATKAVQSLRDDIKVLKSKSAVAPLPSPEMLMLKKDLSLIETRISSMFPEVKTEVKQGETTPQEPPESGYYTKSELAYLNLTKTAGKFSGLFSSGSLSAELDPERIQKNDVPVGKFTGAW